MAIKALSMLGLQWKVLVCDLRRFEMGLDYAPAVAASERSQRACGGASRHEYRVTSPVARKLAL